MKKFMITEIENPLIKLIGNLRSNNVSEDQQKKQRNHDIQFSSSICE